MEPIWKKECFDTRCAEGYITKPKLHIVDNRVNTFGKNFQLVEASFNGFSNVMKSGMKGVLEKHN